MMTHTKESTGASPKVIFSSGLTGGSAGWWLLCFCLLCWRWVAL